MIWQIRPSVDFGWLQPHLLRSAARRQPHGRRLGVSVFCSILDLGPDAYSFGKSLAHVISLTMAAATVQTRHYASDKECGLSRRLFLIHGGGLFKPFSENRVYMSRLNYQIS